MVNIVDNTFKIILTSRNEKEYFKKRKKLACLLFNLISIDILISIKSSSQYIR